MKKDNLLFIMKRNMKRNVFLIIGLILMAVSLFAQNKATISRNVFSFTYIEFNDGCLVISGNHHYKVGEYSSGWEGVLNQISPPEHRNDNAVVRAEVNRFNNEIRRLEAVTEDNQQTIFNRTPSGSWYFVYRVNQRYVHRNYFGGEYDGIPLSETGVMYTLNIWRVNVY